MALLEAFTFYADELKLPCWELLNGSVYFYDSDSFKNVHIYDPDSLKKYAFTKKTDFLEKIKVEINISLKNKVLGVSSLEISNQCIGSKQLEDWHDSLLQSFPDLRCLWDYAYSLIRDKIHKAWNEVSTEHFEKPTQNSSRVITW